MKRNELPKWLAPAFAAAGYHNVSGECNWADALFRDEDEFSVEVFAFPSGHVRLMMLDTNTLDNPLGIYAHTWAGDAEALAGGVVELKRWAVGHMLAGEASQN